MQRLNCTSTNYEEQLIVLGLTVDRILKSVNWSKDGSQPSAVDSHCIKINRPFFILLTVFASHVD